MQKNSPNRYLHLSREQVTDLLRQVAEAKQRHIEWLDELSRVIACRLPPSPVDLEGDAHHRCRFGRWYYGEAPSFLNKDPVFEQLGRIHQAMHSDARDVLVELAAKGRISVECYDRYRSRQRELLETLDLLTREVRIIDCQLDPLTGVCSRQGMMLRLGEERARGIREGQPCALMLMDLDHFKDLNDRWGHQVGDAALRDAAQSCLNVLRPYDRMYRYGGEEFLICLPGTDLTQAFWLGERLRERLINSPLQLGSSTLHFTASFGVALMEADICIEEAILRADQALYEAKARGRNRVCVYPGHLQRSCERACPGSTARKRDSEK